MGDERFNSSAPQGQENDNGLGLEARATRLFGKPELRDFLRSPRHAISERDSQAAVRQAHRSACPELAEGEQRRRDRGQSLKGQSPQRTKLSPHAAYFKKQQRLRSRTNRAHGVRPYNGNGGRQDACPTGVNVDRRDAYPTDP